MVSKMMMMKMTVIYSKYVYFRSELLYVCPYVRMLFKLSGSQVEFITAKHFIPIATHIILTFPP